jgi:hypothetical protein
MQFCVFTEEECEIILSDSKNAQLLNKCKLMLKNFLENGGFEISRFLPIKVIESFGQQSVNTGNQQWHIDDVSMINFVININGEGTEFYDSEKQQIEKLGRGNGIFLIGEQGYALLGLSPTVHRAPIVVSNDRFILKLIIDGSDKIKEYGSEIYYERLKESNKYLENFLINF